MTENFTPERSAKHAAQPSEEAAPANRQPAAAAQAGPLAQSSTHRITAGIVAILLSCVLGADALIQLAASSPLVALVLALASLGNLGAGIMILVLHTQRLGVAPTLSLVMAIVGIAAGLLGVGTPFYGPSLAVVAFVLSILVVHFTSAGILKDKQLAGA